MLSTTVWLLTRNKLPAVKHCPIWHVKVKVKCSRYRPGVAQRVGRGIALLFHDRDTRRGWVVSSTPRQHFTPGKTRYPFYRRLGGTQGRSGRAENLVPTGIGSRTAQPVAQSLHRLSYPAHTIWNVMLQIQDHAGSCEQRKWNIVFIVLRTEDLDVRMKWQ